VCQLRKQFPEAIQYYTAIFTCNHILTSCQHSQYKEHSAVFWVAGRFSMPPANWTVRAFLQLTSQLACQTTDGMLGAVGSQMTLTTHLLEI